MSTDPLPSPTPQSAPPQGAVSRRRLRPFAGFWPAFTWGLRLTCAWRRLLLIAGAGVGLAWLLGAFAVGQEQTGRPHDAYFDAWELYDTALLKFLLPILALLTVARGFSAEIGERTLVYHLVRPISRVTLCVARFFSGVVPAALISTATLLAFSYATELEFPPSYWASLPLTALTCSVGVGAVYYAFATLMRRGMIAALIYTFVFEPLFSSQRGAMQKLSSMFHVRGVHHGLTDEAFAERSENVRLAVQPEDIFDLADVEWGNPSALMEIRNRVAYDTPATASITVLCLTAALLAFTAWRVSQRDYPLKD